MPARSSAAIASSLSASDSSSGSVTQWNVVWRRIAQARRGLARLLGEQRDQAIGRLRPADARELLANQPMLLAAAASRTSATAATVSGAASSRSVCPVGAVSTTITSSR